MCQRRTVPRHGDVGMIKIHFAYAHVDAPWGGANNFIRALHAELRGSGRFTFAESIEDECDILFMNQLGMGPARGSGVYPISLIRRLAGKSKRQGARARRARRLVVRAVNLNWHAHRLGLRNLTLGWWNDRRTIELLNIADDVIFQSAYQREFFVKAGYRGSNDVVIHNGADPSFWCDKPAHPLLDGPLRLISSSASPRKTKRHDLIAKISLFDGVEVTHLGAWPPDVNPGAVRLLGTQSRENMVNLMSSSHYFLHPAIKDPCPNAVFEAICAGLPVIYSAATGSSVEIVGANGLALDESDLARTVEKARIELANLRARVLTNRTGYTIGRATREYRQIFEQLAA